MDTSEYIENGEWAVLGIFWRIVYQITVILLLQPFSTMPLSYKLPHIGVLEIEAIPMHGAWPFTPFLARTPRLKQYNSRGSRKKIYRTEILGVYMIVYEAELSHEPKATINTFNLV